MQQYGEPADREMLIRLPQDGRRRAGDASRRRPRRPSRRCEGRARRQFTIVNREMVSPVIGPICSGAASTPRWRRWRRSPSTSRALPVLVRRRRDRRDAPRRLVTLAFLVFFRYDLSLNVVAAILTITGYSVNDTIVIFDRVRENLRSHARDRLEPCVNQSVNQTLGRTVITAGTTFLSVLALYLFGGEALRGFAFTMLVGSSAAPTRRSSSRRRSRSSSARRGQALRQPRSGEATPAASSAPRA